MSEDTETNANGGHYEYFEITELGMGLRQTAVAGIDGKKVSIEFTRGAIGTGRPSPGEDTYFMTGLVSPVFDVPVKESFAQDRNHVMALVVQNMGFTDDVLMTEMGIFARLVEKGEGGELIALSPEVLYGYAYTVKYDYIPAGTSGYTLYREIAVDTVLSRSGKLEVIYDGSRVYVTAKDLADVRDLAQEALSAAQEGGGGVRETISDTPPENPKDGDIWLKPIGSISVNGEVGGSVTPMYLSGTYLGETPPEDTSMLWVKPVS